MREMQHLSCSCVEEEATVMRADADRLHGISDPDIGIETGNGLDARDQRYVKQENYEEVYSTTQQRR
jgi:hypothetical protein